MAPRQTTPAPAVMDLRNLGPKTAQALAQIGICTLADLRRRGAVAAYVALKRSWPATSLNALYALVGAVENRDWREVQRTQRLELLNAVDAYESVHPAAPVRRGASKKNGV